MKARQKSRSIISRSALVCFLMACMAALCMNQSGVKLTAYAARESVESLSLYRKNPEENAVFQLTNMFPGDSKTQHYRISISYTGTVTVSFQATVTEDSEKLGEVLTVRVRQDDADEVLYEGLLADMPQIDRVLSTDKEACTEELTYEVTVGLSTKVGNEYQNKRLSADLCWWAEGSKEPDDPMKPSEPDEGEDSEGSVDEGSEGPQGGSLINPPGTGDDSQLILWLAVLSTAIACMIVLLVNYCRKRMVMSGAGVREADEQMEQCRYPRYGALKSRRRLLLGIFVVILLILAFGITSWALVYQKVVVEENVFQTGQVSICLNDNQPIFDEVMLFEPGMVVEKDFTLRSDSSCDVYYRLHFSDIDGAFAEAVTVAVADGETILFQGTLAEMNGVRCATGLLKEGEERKLRITFHVPEDCGNKMQNQTIWFDLHAEAVQAVNNPLGLFE